MKIKTFPLLFALLFLILFWCAVPTSQAQSFSDKIFFSYNGSLILLASDNGNVNLPQIVPSLGFSVAYSLFKNLNIEFTEDIYFSNYEYIDYPMACSPETRKAFVMGFTTGLQATGFFPITNKGTAFRVFGGMTADLRLVVQAFGLTQDEQPEVRAQTNAIRNYFWSNGRMFFAAGGAGIDFPISEKQKLGFDLRVWAPLYRMWTDNDIPAIDGWRFGLGLRISPNKKRYTEN